MATLSYRGATPANAGDVATKGYVTVLAAGNMTQTTVNNLITSGLSGYVLKSYVDSQDALNATSAFVDAGDATRLHLSQLGAVNGIAGLDRTGKVEASRVPVLSTQRWPSPFISPSAYHSSTITATGATETQLFTVSVADPGYTYKLLLTGVLDGSSATDGQYPIVRVRQGSTTGQLVGVGNGIGENYIAGGVPMAYTTAGSATYPVPTGYTNLDIIALGGGGGGSSFWGAGGAAGVFSSASLVLGSTLPVTTTTLNVTVGAAGAGAGGQSQVTGTGITTVTGAGGAAFGSNNAQGKSPGTLSLHQQNYVGGAAATSNQPGNPPGGGGGANDKPGATGAVWFFAYNALTGTSGPIRVLPQSLDLQVALTGATTLYVMLVSSGTGSVTASTLRPSLMAIPVPA